MKGSAAMPQRIGAHPPARCAPAIRCRGGRKTRTCQLHTPPIPSSPLHHASCRIWTSAALPHCLPRLISGSRPLRLHTTSYLLLLLLQLQLLPLPTLACVLLRRGVFPTWLHLYRRRAQFILYTAFVSPSQPLCLRNHATVSSIPPSNAMVTRKAI